MGTREWLALIRNLWWALNRNQHSEQRISQRWLLKPCPRQVCGFSARRSLYNGILLLFQSSPIRILGRSSILKQFYVVRALSDTSATNEERYIQYSRVPTDHFQPGLPRLPIPKLEETLERYLAALRSVCSDEDYQQSRACVEEFKKDGQGRCMYHSFSTTSEHNLSIYGVMTLCA